MAKRENPNGEAAIVTRPYWRGPQENCNAWEAIGASPFLRRQISFGVYDPPTVPFTKGEFLSELRQMAEDIEFAAQDLADGCASGIYEEISEEEAEEARQKGYMISSAFVVWQDGPEGRKGRFVVNFHRQSKHWSKGSVRMETLPAYALDLKRGDHMLSFDIKSGYRHMRLAPAMRPMFMFRYQGKYYRCVALPFGWGRSPMWFTGLMAPLVQHLRSKLNIRTLPYLDDFLLAPSRAGTEATKRSCTRAKREIERLLARLGITRHPSKGEWSGSTRVEHLGVVIDTMQMKFFVAPRKIDKVRSMARQLIGEARHGRRCVSRKRVASFVGLCVSLTLAMPFSRFYTRSLYWDMGRRQEARLAARSGLRCRLSHQSLRDLRTWRELTSTEREGRPIHPERPEYVLHTDAADVGYGGTLGTTDKAGDPGLWEAQGVWNWQDRAESISYRELKSIRMLLTDTNRTKPNSFRSRLRDAKVQNVKLWCDNMATVHITNAMVSASRPMMRELRLLKAELDKLGLHISSTWLPSVLNKYADGLSRRFPRGDLQVRGWLRWSLMDGIGAPVDSFPYRPLGETVFFARKQTLRELDSHWDQEQVRLLCPPMDLIAPVVSKLRKSRSPAMLLIPDWPRQPWHKAALELAQRSHRMEAPPSAVWAGARTLNNAWRILPLEINLDVPSNCVSESLRAAAPSVEVNSLNSVHLTTRQPPILMEAHRPETSIEA